MISVGFNTVGYWIVWIVWIQAVIQKGWNNVHTCIHHCILVNILVFTIFWTTDVVSLMSDVDVWCLHYITAISSFLQELGNQYSVLKFEEFLDSFFLDKGVIIYTSIKLKWEKYLKSCQKQQKGLDVKQKYWYMLRQNWKIFTTYLSRYFKFDAIKQSYGYCSSGEQWFRSCYQLLPFAFFTVL